MKKIAVFYTGGTIGMVQEQGVLIPSAEGPLKGWLDQYARENHLNMELIHGYEPIDSANADPQLWSQLSTGIKQLNSEYNGVLILHGTDTMAYTASALSFMLPSLKIPVILTGSQHPLSEKNSDAELNLSRSLRLLSELPEERLPNEVFIFFDNYLYRGNRSTKIDNEGNHAFESPNYPHCLRYDDQGRIEFNPFFKPEEKHPFLFDCDSLRPVNIKVVFLYPGIDDLDVDLETCKAIILLTFGMGNAPTQRSFLNKIHMLTTHGIIILNLSQCVHKSSLSSHYQTGSALRQRGATDMRDITLEACFTKLYYVLNIGYLNPRKYLTHNLVGEMNSTVPAFSSKFLNPDFPHFTPAKTCLVLQNSKYFGLGLLGDILRENNLTVIPLFVPEDYQALGKLDSRRIDFVISLGSNASVTHADRLPWIPAEIKFIQIRIEQELPLIGVCFGSQLIATAAGAHVQRGTLGREIGFYPLHLTSEGRRWPTMALLSPELSNVFEFHGETFSLPPGATLLASTDRYPQAYRIGRRCLGMQFHLEITDRELNALASEYLDYISEGGFNLGQLKRQALDEFPKLIEQTKRFYDSVIRNFSMASPQIEEAISIPESQSSDSPSALTIEPSHSQTALTTSIITDRQQEPLSGDFPIAHPEQQQITFRRTQSYPQLPSGELKHSTSSISFFATRRDDTHRRLSHDTTQFKFSSISP